MHGVGFNLAFQLLAVDRACDGIAAGRARQTLVELRHLLTHLRRHRARFLVRILNRARVMRRLAAPSLQRKSWRPPEREPSPFAPRIAAGGCYRIPGAGADSQRYRSAPKLRAPTPGCV